MTPKYRVIADELRENIKKGIYKSTMLLPTESQLCSLYDVSRQTVRQALALLSAEHLIERRQGSGSHIIDQPLQSAQPRRAIAVIMTYISDYIFPHLLREMEEVLSRNNCAPLLFATQNRVSNERKILETLLASERLDGILVEGTRSALPNPNLDLYRRLIDRNIPIVFMHGNYCELGAVPHVLDANADGSRMLVKYLHQKGHRVIGGIFKSDDIQGQQRYAGYTQALLDLNLPLDDDHIFWYDTNLKTRILSSDTTMDTIEETLDGCTAVICYNDEIACHLTGYLTKKGRKIPEDLAVVSFDNSSYSERYPLSITSLSHGDFNIGQISAELLLNCINGIPIESVSVPWFLVEKESS